MAKKSKFAAAAAARSSNDHYPKKAFPFSDALVESTPVTAPTAALPTREKSTISTLDKLIAKHTEKHGQAPDSKVVGVLQLQAAYLDGRKDAGIGRSAPRTEVTDAFRDALENIVLTAGREIVSFVNAELPKYKVHTLTLQIRDGEPKLRTFRIGKPHKPKS